MVHGYNFEVAEEDKLSIVDLDHNFGSCSFVVGIGVWQSGLRAEH